MDRLLLLLYVALVLWFSYTQNMAHLLYAFLALLPVFFLSMLRSKRPLGYIRPLLFALSFTLAISLPYTFWTGDYSYTLRIVLRVLVLYLLTFLILSHVNLYSALAFSRSLSYMLVLATGFMTTYKRQLGEFSYALASRTLRRMSMSENLRFLKRVLLYFFFRSVSDMEEVSRAMKSRGFELD